MSLTHRDLAALVAALYDAPDTVPWAYLSNPDANVFMGIIRQGEFLTSVSRGSFNMGDWLRDLRLKKIQPLGRDVGGEVHAGIYSGTQEATDLLLSYHEPGNKIVLAGHSLGGGRPSQIAGNLIARGIVPHFICTWGEPASGEDAFKELIAGIPHARYRNNGFGRVDRVTQSTLPFGYVQASEMIDVSAPPPSPAPWDPFELHHFSLYQSVTPDTEIP